MITVDFDPVIFSLGPLSVRYYGLMYVISFINANFLFKWLIKKGYLDMSVDKLDSLITHLFFGVFLGARVFYVFIYNWADYQNDLLSIFAVWKGGLSFHGGVVGVLVSGYLFCRKNKVNFVHLFDAGAIAGVQGIFFGRMGNFINGELYGRITDVPWAMIFVNGGPNPRHPSQLYEGISEGLILWLVLFLNRKQIKTPGLLSSIFLMGYGLARYIIEFFREPDSQLGYYFGGTTTMGQILCVIMFFCGLGYFIYCLKKKRA